MILGTALHTGIEKDVETAIHEYYFSYPVITDAHVTEAMKLERQIQKAMAIVPHGMHEILIETEKFKGFIDLLVPVGNGLFDLWDFKCSNNVDHYLESRQLHLYKHYFEKTHPGMKIRKMFFLFVPKNNSRQKSNENLFQFRERVLAELEETEVRAIEVPFNYSKVIEHLEIVQDIQEETEYKVNENWLCRYCDYEEYCQKGRNYMILPTTERRNISETKKRKIWIYGAAFSGKTTMLDDAPNPLNLNTDGNIQFVTMPYISIKDEIKVEGRVTKRKYAWEVFKEAIAELERKQNSFETIIIDLLEDTREMCRVFMYDQLKIQHESDSGYGKGWDIIKTEYLSTIRRFFNLDYENIVVVSHEDVSKDITKKNGQNITRIAPNIQDAIANKIAGMVDIVARVVVEDDGSRTLNFKQNEVIFGGGRLKGIQQTTIPLSWVALMQVYDDANAAASEKSEKKSKPEVDKSADLPEQILSDSGLICAADTYFYIPSDDNYVIKHKGDVIPEGAQEIGEEEFKAGIKRIATENNPKPDEVPADADTPATSNEPKAEPGKRTRRSRKA